MMISPEDGIMATRAVMFTWWVTNIDVLSRKIEAKISESQGPEHLQWNHLQKES